MKTINWSGYKWITQERWGQIHPNKPWNWYDESCVSLNVSNELKLSIRWNPEDFIINQKLIRSDWGTGLVCCETNFSFGVFEIEAKLPKGRGLWPAFWLYPKDVWPPEIDVFEGYSGKKNYKTRCFLKPFNIENCTHSKEGFSQHVRKPWLGVFNSNPAETFNKYSLLWNKDRLIIGINGKTVREITDTDTLNELANYEMRVIINNHIDGKYKDDFTTENPFIIKSFNYYKL